MERGDPRTEAVALCAYCTALARTLPAPLMPAGHGTTLAAAFSRRLDGIEAIDVGASLEEAASWPPVPDLRQDRPAIEKEVNRATGPSL